MVSQAIDPTSLREIRYYPRVIKYDICQEKRNDEICGSRKLESSPRCSICKDQINGKKVGESNKGKARVNKSLFYATFSLSFAYWYIYFPILFG